MSGTVQITFERYLELLHAENKLSALECAGVDNWSGYEVYSEYLESEAKILVEANSKKRGERAE